MDELKFGIEIIAAMKASAYNTDIEQGRILALEETEVDRMEGLTPEYFNALPLEDRQRFIKIAKNEKERLHTQARYVAGIALEYLKSECKTKISNERFCICFNKKPDNIDGYLCENCDKPIKH